MAEEKKKTENKKVKEEKTQMTRERAYNIVLNKGIHHKDYKAAYMFLLVNCPSLLSEIKRVKGERKDGAKLTEDLSYVEGNVKALQSYNDEYTFNKFVGKARKEENEVKQIISGLSLYEQDDKGVKTLLVSERKNKYLQTLFEAKKAEVVARFSLDKKFAALSEDEKRVLFKESVKDATLASLYTAHIATKVKGSNVTPEEIGNPKYFDRVAKQVDNLKKLTNDASLAGQKLRINTDMILFDVANVAADVKEFSQKVKEKAKALTSKAREIISHRGRDAHYKVAESFENLSNYLTGKAGGLIQKVEEKADKVSNGKYTKFAQPIVDLFRANKYQMAVDIAATAALTATGLSAVGLAGYGVYMMARSWVAPRWNEAQKMRIEAQRKGYEPESFITRFKKASKKIEGNEKEKRKSRVAMALGAVVFGGLTAAAIASGGVLPIAAVSLPVIGKVGLMPVVKGGLSNMVQGTEAGIALKRFLGNRQNANAKKELKSAGIGLGLGILATTLTQFIGNHIGGGHDAADTLNSNNGSAENLAQNTGAENIASNAGSENVAPVAGTHDANQITAAENASRSDSSYDGRTWDRDGKLQAPGTVDYDAAQADQSADLGVAHHFDNDRTPHYVWSKDMGIRKSEYLSNLRKEENVDEYFKWYHYKLHNESVTPRSMYEHAWIKLSQDGMMDRFPKGTTKEQVITQYFALLGHYGTKNCERAQEMQEMYKFLFCDGEVADVHNGTIDHVMNAKEYMLAHSDETNHNILSSVKAKCPDADLRYKGQVLQTAIKETPEVKVPELSDNIDIPNDDINIEDTQITFEDDTLKGVDIPEEKIKFGVDHSMTTDGSSARTGQGAIIKEDITDTSSGKNMVSHSAFGNKASVQNEKGLALNNRTRNSGYNG